MLRSVAKRRGEISGVPSLGGGHGKAGFAVPHIRGGPGRPRPSPPRRLRPGGVLGPGPDLRPPHLLHRGVLGRLHAARAVAAQGALRAVGAAADPDAEEDESRGADTAEAVAGPREGRGGGGGPSQAGHRTAGESFGGVARLAVLRAPDAGAMAGVAPDPLLPPPELPGAQAPGRLIPARAQALQSPAAPKEIETPGVLSPGVSRQ